MSEEYSGGAEGANVAVRSETATTTGENSSSGPGDTSSSTMGSIHAISTRRVYISVAILCFINLINYMDRYTLAGVLTNVKAFYQMNNSEAGLLQTCFIVSYMIMAPIFGCLGDRYSRKYIMAAGILFWSATTLLGSFVPQGYYGWFFFLRALVGTGEASYSTIAPTIIADYFVGSARTKALSLFYFAIPVGSGLGYIVGAKVASLLGHWYWALRVTPPLGVLSVILILAVLVEPPRGEAEGGTLLKNTSIMDDIVQVSKIPSFTWVTLGFTCVTFSVGALAWWVPDFIVHAMETHGAVADRSNISMIFGIITVLAGILGVVLGTVSATVYRRYDNRADPLICAYSMLAAVPLIFVACLYADQYTVLTYVLVFFGVTLLCMNWVLVADITMYVVIPTRRSIASALQITVSHALGDASSPYVVGTISDAISGGSQTPYKQYMSLQYALFVPVFVLVLGVACFLINTFYIVRDKQKCTIESHGHTTSAINLPGTIQEMPIDQNCYINDLSADRDNLIIN